MGIIVQLCYSYWIMALLDVVDYIEYSSDAIISDGSYETTWEEYYMMRDSLIKYL